MKPTARLVFRVTVDGTLDDVNYLKRILAGRMAGYGDPRVEWDGAEDLSYFEGVEKQAFEEGRLDL